jgi:hypothetical protein
VQITDFYCTIQNKYSLDIEQTRVSLFSFSFLGDGCLKYSSTERHSDSGYCGGYRFQPSQSNWPGYPVRYSCQLQYPIQSDYLCYSGSELKELVELSREGTTLILDEVRRPPISPYEKLTCSAP